MSKLLYTVIVFASISVNIVFAQDTVVVQTFQWSDDSRSGDFTFPDPGEQFRQVLLRYNMRCHDAKVSTDANFEGCREWDYSCNTFVTDSGRLDYISRYHPNYYIPGWGVNDIPYVNGVLYSYIEKERNVVQIENSSQLDTTLLPEHLINVLFSTEETGSGGFRMLYFADDLSIQGLKAGAIHQLILPDNEDAGSLRFARIRMVNTPMSTLVSDTVLLGKDDEYFYDHINFTPDREVLTLSEPFVWDGTSNILIEFSFRLDETSPDNIVIKSTLVDGEISRIKQSGHCLEFQGGPGIIPEREGFEQIDSQITFAFWAFGDPNFLPTQTFAASAVSPEGHRQFNVHLPWSDGNLYFDCGNAGNSYDRISMALPEAYYKGGWHHFAFVKNVQTGVMEVWIDGSLWHSDMGKNLPITLDSLHLGSSISGENGWHGRMRDFALYKKALAEDEIQQLMLRGAYPDGIPAIDDLIGFYPLDDGTGRSPKGMAPGHNLEATFFGTPQWALIDVAEVPVGGESLSRSMALGFVQGNMSVSVMPEVERDSFVMLTTRIEHYDVQNDQLVFVEDLFFQLGDVQRVLDEDWVVIDIVDFNIAGYLDVTNLKYLETVPARFELVSLVTPYGFDLDLGQQGKTFLFDVTHLSHVLRGEKRLDITMGGEHQTELDLQFHFVRGEPIADVIDVRNIWPFRRAGFSDILSDAAFEPREIDLSPDGARFIVRSSITGHDQNGEFVRRNHFVKADDFKHDFDVWKECADNPIYPQGGTWIFDRAGWCPGAPTNLVETDVSGAVSAGESAVFDYGVNGLHMESANYLASHQLVTYGQPYRNIDAAVIMIKKPNSSIVSYERFNPTCQDPIIEIRNAGGALLESVEITYGLKGNPKESFTWTGELKTFETAEVTLPVDNQDFWMGDNQVFEVELANPNGMADEFAANNVMSSSVAMVDVIDQQDVYFEIRTNLIDGDNSYRIRNQNGEIVAERDNIPASTTVQEYFTFPDGCYTLEVTDQAQDGLYFWFFPGNGSGWAQIRRNIPPISEQLKEFNADFGSGFQYDFVIDSPVGIKENSVFSSVTMYPNPVTDRLNIAFEGEVPAEKHITVTTAAGLLVDKRIVGSTGETVEIDTGNYPDGVYLVHINNGSQSVVHKIVKTTGDR